MLYVSIDGQYQFEKAMPSSRMEKYSYEAICAMYEYYERLSEELGENIHVDESLEYPCCEYEFIEDAVNDYGDMDDIYREMVEEYLSDKDIEIDDVEDWEQYIDELDGDEIREKCIEFLEDCYRIDYLEELSNGCIFIVSNEG